MKKLTLALLTMVLMLPVLPGTLNATDNPTRNRPEPTAAEAELANKMIARLYEIRAMDIKGLAKAEKKQLRHEVKGIKQDLKAISGGVYLSFAALIIIILLLLLLA